MNRNSAPSLTLTKVTEMLAALVAFPTVSGESNLELQLWLGDAIRARGGSAELIAGAPGRWNLVGRFGPAVSGGLLLAGHTDVVPASDGWDHPPFVVRVADDRISGRGTADMKGFFAAALVALDEVDVSQLHAPVHVLASYDEEVGCVGIRDVLPLLAPMGVQPELVVVGEPTSMRPALSHLGKRAFEVTVSARSGHSSKSATLPSAIVQAARLIAALELIQNDCPVSSDQAAPYSVNVGTISGGEQVNVIAALCRFNFEVRVAADHDAAVVLHRFHSTVEEVRHHLAAVGGDVVIAETTSYPALRSDVLHPSFAAAAAMADSGAAIDLGFGTEGGLIAEALDVPVMVCGPGDIAVAHRPGEYVPTRDLERCVGFVNNLIDRFCRLP